MDKSAWELHTDATKDQFDSKLITLGPWTSFSFLSDPKHVSFVLARYKFVSKMLAEKLTILEIGCGDGVGSPIIASIPSVKTIHCIDWDQRNIDGNSARYSFLSEKVKFVNHDINNNPYLDFGKFEAAFMVDVIEHVEPKLEDQFMQNICDSLTNDGILITGTPNIYASEWASPQSAAQHINLKSQETLANLMRKYFQHTFLFSMNDEVIHTGYSKMAHYIWTVSINPKI